MERRSVCQIFIARAVVNERCALLACRALSLIDACVSLTTIYVQWSVSERERCHVAAAGGGGAAGAVVKLASCIPST